MINIYDTMLSDPDYFKQISVNDMLFVTYKCPQREKLIHLFTHYNYLIYSLSGSRKLIRNNDAWIMTDDVALFVKKSAYAQEWYQQEDWQVLAFFIPDEYLKKLLNEYRSSLPAKDLACPSNENILRIQVNEMTKAFFQSMLPYFSQHPAPSTGLLEIKFRELFLNIITNPGNAALVGSINEMCKYDKPFLPEIMESNYMFNLSMAEFAKLSHRSLATFKRDFMKIYHMPPGKWLLTKRIEQAHLLLTTTNTHINEIAFESGFESGAHFSRVFKQRYGCSPHHSRMQVA